MWAWTSHAWSVSLADHTDGWRGFLLPPCVAHLALIHVTGMEGYTKLKCLEIAASEAWRTDPHTRLLFICLLMDADDDGFIDWPGANNIRSVEDFGLGSRSVIDGMDALRKLGLIRFEPDGLGTRLVDPERFRDRQTKKQALSARRVRLCRERKKRADKLPETQKVTRNTRGSVTVRRDGSYEQGDDALPVTKKPYSTSTSSTKSVSRSSRSRVECPDGVSQDVWSDYLQLRKAKKAPVTVMVLRMLEQEAAKAGVTIEAAMMTCVAHGWSGFKSEWMQNSRSGTQSHKSRMQPKSHEAGEIDF